MKTLKITLLILLSIVTFQSMAQDILTKADGSSIEVKILEISETTIKYKSYNNQDGPLRTIATSSVHKVHYENGIEEEFSPLSDEGQVEQDKNAPYSLDKKGLFVDVLIGTDLSDISAVSLDLGLRFGHKWYFLPHERKLNVGFQMNWLRVSGNLLSDFTFSIDPFNFGICSIYKITDNIGVEANFVTGLHTRISRIDFGNWGPFSTDIDGSAGINVNPSVKFRHNKFALGLDYKFGREIGTKTIDNQHIVSLSIGAKF